jgi:hypothetical protein
VPPDVTLPIPSITIKNIGNADGADNGAGIKDVIMQVLSAMATEASTDKGIPKQFRGLLKLNVASIGSQFGPKFQSQLSSLGLPTDLSKLGKDPGKSLQSALGNLLSGGAGAPANGANGGKPAGGNLLQGLDGMLKKKN